ncbi:putative baseplate assembly protein [Corallococcus aberystwythensis]|uniref:Putative baseplate assembly protein n=2 Tax=Corallococcus aberystwythensis TaxID=2316722 RepID=A0A3A8PHX9_9BACT|nr:putative baseplate assembly protein [Corallococcus aberystwythensis]
MRAGRTQATVLARMLQRLATWHPAAVDSPQGTGLHGVDPSTLPLPRQRVPAPLRGLVPLSVRQGPPSSSDLTYGLLDAWATVADVLSFYQERITQEGYLRTATEDFSVQELVRTVGVTPRPAMSAQVKLCFTVSDKPGAPDSLLLPKGLAVQSMPAPGGVPQVFETSADLLARPEWSAMPLWHPTRDVLASPVASLRADAPGLLLRDGSHGIHRGATVLVRATTSDGKEWLALPGVTRTGSANQRGCIVWDAPLAPTLGGALLSEPQAWTCRPPEALLGHDAPAWDTLSLEKKLQYGATPVGGTQRLELAQGAWQPLGAPPGKVLCLLMDGRGLFAGVEDQGLLRSQDRGATWTPVKALTRMNVLCLGRDTQDRLVAGTRRHGVLRSTDGDSWETLRGKTIQETSQLPMSKPVTQDLRLPSTPVRSVAGFLTGKHTTTAAFLLAGTDEGLFCWEEQTGTWRPTNEGLPLAGKSEPTSTPVSVLSIVEDEKNQRFVLGTSKGVFSSPRIGTPWKVWDPATAGQPVKTLLLDAKGRLFVALEDGGLYRAVDGKRLTDVPVPPKTPSGVARVSALLPLASGPGGPPGLLAALTEGLFVTRDGGTTWTALPALPALPAPAPLEVWAVAEPEPGTVLAFTPVVGVTETQWPGWTLEPGRLELARLVPRIAEGQQLVLEQQASDGTGVPLALVTVTLVETEQVKAFGDRRLITRLQVKPAVSGLDRASTRVRSCLAPLPLLEQQIRTPALLLPNTDPSSLLAQDDFFFALVRGQESNDLIPRKSVRVAGSVADPTGRTVVVVGQRMRAWVAAPALELLSEDELTQQLLRLGQVLEVMEWPTSAPDTSPTWRLRTEHGFVGKLQASEDQLLLLPAAKDAEQVALPRKVVGTTRQPGSTQLKFETELEEMLDPDTVAVRGNVVEATHGATVNEVLGSGDARRAQQQFRLKRSPLVWLNTPDGPELQLELFVNQQRWHPVDDWSGQKPDSRVYQLRVEMDGTVRVFFGDGVRGARLPTGAENVTATYRTGGGQDGNVGAGQIILLRQRLLGLRTVDNPLPATGGTDAQTASELRTQASLQLQTLERIVSLRDFADYVRALPGVARVRSRPLWNGHAPVLSLTVATTEEDTGHQLSPGLEEDIRQKVERFRPAHHVLHVDSFVPQRFHLGATLTVDPDFVTEQVRKAAAQVLTDAFTFEQRELAQPVATSDILRLLSGVRGVLNARVTALRLSVAAPGPVPAVLRAADSRWDAQSRKVLPAEMLLLEKLGPVLDVETGP